MLYSDLVQGNWGKAESIDLNNNNNYAQEIENRKHGKTRQLTCGGTRVSEYIKIKNRNRWLTWWVTSDYHTAEQKLVLYLQLPVCTGHRSSLLNLAIKI